MCKVHVKYMFASTSVENGRIGFAVPSCIGGRNLKKFHVGIRTGVLLGPGPRSYHMRQSPDALGPLYTIILYGTEILRFAPKTTIFKRFWSRPLRSDRDEQTFIWKLISSAFYRYKFYHPTQPTGGDSLNRILHVYSCLYTTCTRIGSLWTKFLGGGGLHNIQLTVPKPIVNW